jgi:preprotein translocase subunit SecG
MYIALSLLHVLIASGLILIVLLQSGKGADIGAAFGGGSSQTVFGGRGAATFLSKATTVLAILFMVMSIALTLLASQGGGSTVVPEDGPKPASSAPAVPVLVPRAPRGRRSPNLTRAVKWGKTQKCRNTWEGLP